MGEVMGLSPREAAVLALMAAGKTNKAVALELGLSENTVKEYASSIYRKMGVQCRAAAVYRFAAQ